MPQRAVTQADAGARLTAPEWLYQQLRERIISGRLDAGEALRQQHLAAEFGLSAIPVREALRMLEADRLVTIHPNRGAVVRGVSLGDALENVRIRLALEPMAIEMATPHINQADIETAATLLDSYAEVDDMLSAASLNRRFHFALYATCGSPRLLAMIESLFDDALRVAHVTISHRQGNAQAHREHKRIFTSWRCGRGSEAAERLRAHIQRSQRTLEALIAQQAD